MIEVSVETDQLQTTLLQRFAISGVLSQGLREVRLAEITRSQTLGKIRARNADNRTLEHFSSLCGARDAAPFLHPKIHRNADGKKQKRP